MKTECVNLQFTHAPWHIEVHSGAIGLQITLIVAEEDADPRLRTAIAEIRCGSGIEAQANAKLISAAPELYYACVALLQIVENKVDSWGHAVIKKEVIIRAKQAIQKVEI